ncbi:MAG: hypothetical protein PHO12_01420 [Bacteroidales bacterium]|nr:hypothetical protein [Bacteroidales bacterium]MDD4685080.1 hypothetical protein [Bacteroidales bacterium]
MSTKLKRGIRKWKRFYPQLKHKHRLIVMDSETFTEKFTLKLTAVNLFTFVGLGIIVLILLTIVLIAFTPLREYIPGYTNAEMEKQAYKNAEKIDSLTKVISQQELMLNNIRMVVLGEDVPDLNFVTIDSLKNYDNIQLERSKADSLLRLSFE